MYVLLSKFLCFLIVGGFFFETKKLNAFVPYFYLPSSKNLEKESLSIGRNAYQLLYFGQVKDSLNMAKLAVKVNKNSEKLWIILADSQVANELYDNALFSLSQAEALNPKMAEIHFAKSGIYLKNSEIKKAKNSLQIGLNIQPENYRAIFQLGNIFLMEKNYQIAINKFSNATTIKPDFWQAINNQGLAYYEIDKINLAIDFFDKALDLEENAETLLALAASLKDENIKESILLVKKALRLDPNYVDLKYREEQLWGEKIQKSTEKLFKNEKLIQDVNFAKTKINNKS